MPDPPYSLRVCQPGDEQALSLVASASFLEAFAGTLDGPDILAHCLQNNSVAKYMAWLADPAVRIAVAEIKGAPVGYALLCPPDLPIPCTPADIELKRIYLLHRFQGLGVGAALLQWAANEARSMNMGRLLLGVYGGNDKAIAFYHHSGFGTIGTRQFLVGRTLHDDLVLGLIL
jgi:GNAT superfamily N-acetyltransferase